MRALVWFSLFSFVVLGSSAAGKTSLIQRYCRLSLYVVACVMPPIQPFCLARSNLLACSLRLTLLVVTTVQVLDSSVPLSLAPWELRVTLYR